MNRYKLTNTITAWFAFAVAAVTYLLTIEPAASFWDCGAFVLVSYNLEIGHPPGAPFYMLTGRFFSLFASDPTYVAMMVNAMSALASAFTILFLFLTITHLARKITIKDENNISTSQIISIMGAGLVGSLAFTFSTSFWFSAVEAEVYAYSSLFTAAVFWSILKWEEVADSPHSDRWLILISYLMGLSIGVHLLNLLAIPAIVLVYYFKKYDTSFKGIALAFFASCLILAVIMYGFIPGSVEMAGWFELFFVNQLEMSFNSGALIYVICVLAALSWAIFESYTGKSENRIRISFMLIVILLGIPFIGNSIWLPILIILAISGWLFFKKINQRLIHTIVLSLTVLFIGYSTYTVTVIRSLANPPMDQNSPDNMFALQSYLNREQYGHRPLFFGQHFNSELKVENRAFVRREGSRIWMKDTIDGGRDRYISPGRRFQLVHAREHSTVFPRMHSSQEHHIDHYINWGRVVGRPVTYRGVTIQKPTMRENLRFFFNYQVNFMYWRYFMWNFSGRQNDIQGHGEVEHGNWITGFNFIDRHMVGCQLTLPPDFANNRGRNVYFMLPLLLGILGIFFMVYGGKKGLQSFWVVLLLFFMTGLAIVVYLNQTPLQPRERDYAYVGSFYAFAIWIGFGVLALIKLFKKIMPKTLAASLATTLALAVPIQMLSQNWDDHNRSGRRTMPDFAWNYLMSLSPNAIIFTHGDNDSFPLWYLQSVQGVRPDVRIVNLSYLNTDWYIDQMRRGHFESAPLPLNMTRRIYAEGVRTANMVNSQEFPLVEEWIDREFELGQALAFYKSDSPQARDRFTGQNFMPSQNLFLVIDSAQIVRTGTVRPEEVHLIEPVMPIRLRNRLFKNEFVILDLLYNNNWERPIYYAYTVGGEANLGLNHFSRLTGIARRIVPIRHDSENAIDTKVMYYNMMNRFRWGNVADPRVYLDETNRRMCFHFRMLFGKLAKALIEEGQYEKALNVVNRALEVMPIATVPSDWSILPFATSYYMLGETEKGDELLRELLDKTILNLNWFKALNPRHIAGSTISINRNLFTLQEILLIIDRNETGLVADGYTLHETELWEKFIRFSEFFRNFR